MINGQFFVSDQPSQSQMCAILHHQPVFALPCNIRKLIHLANGALLVVRAGSRLIRNVSTQTQSSGGVA